MRSSTLLLCSSLLLAAACGGDDGDTVNPSIDASNNIDAPTAIDAPQANCTISTANFGDKGALQGNAIFRPGQMANSANDDELDFFAALEAAPPTDFLQIQLYAGYGVFGTGAVTPGTYQLTGDETNFATCGACVIITTDVTQNSAGDNYMATGGTLTVTTAGTANGQMLVGSLSNVTLTHVNIDDTTGETTAVGDGCNTQITSASFSGTLMAPPANKPGAALAGKRALAH